MKNLMIIEGFGKLKSISQYLGKDWIVIATGGHLVDLDPDVNSGYGFYIDTLETKWKIIDNSKSEIVKKINQLAFAVNQIFICSDPDREGEAIAHHIYNVIEKQYHHKVKRASFNEISKKAIQSALENAREIDTNLVNAQFARRLYDRYFGFKASKLVQRKLSAKSAGRVQSVALVILQQRQKAIDNFIPETTYSIQPKLENKLKIKLINNQTLETIKFSKIFDAQEFAKELNLENFVLKKTENKTQLRAPAKPLTTSSLQILAGKKFKLNPKEIEAILQRFYQGVDVDGKSLPLTTYPRTDSTVLSESFCASAKDFVENNFTSEYWNDSFWFNKQKQKSGVQGGHEALRIMSFNNKPEDLTNYLTKNELKIYDLIYKHTLKLFLSFNKVYQTTFYFQNDNHLFQGISKVEVFDGWKILDHKWGVDELDEINDENQIINIQDFQINESYSHESEKPLIETHITTAPTRFSQAELIGYLEKHNIGRPSTYATLAEINIKNNYVVIENNKSTLAPMGEKVAKFEIQHLSDCINQNFSAELELELDKIADGKLEWKPFLREKISFINEIISLVEQKVADRSGIEILATKECPKCQGQAFKKESPKNKKVYWSCEFRQWNGILKKESGECSYVEWINGK